jgi:DNA-binding CsgD family transcriptional regulator
VTAIGLLERTAELSRIAELLDGAEHGEGGVLLVRGPAGIGKTVLLGAAGRMASERGLLALTARGSELELDFPFGVARQLFEPLVAGARATERSRLFAGAAGLAADVLGAGAGPSAGAVASDQSFAVANGLYWVVANLSQRRPLLLVVDDVQWADTSSLRWLLYVIPRVGGLRVGLLAAARSGERDPSGELVARLEQLAGRATIRPAALSEDGAQTLLAGALGARPASGFVRACHEVTGGNPFLLRELVVALAADGIEPTTEAAARVKDLGPESVSRSVLLRLARLGAPASGIARAVAILGDGAELRHAAALADVGLPVAAKSADALAEMGVLEPGTPLRFVHAIVHAAVRADMPAAERAVRHGDAARLLAHDGQDSDAICAQLLESEPAGDPQVVRLLREGAHSALARGAPETAVAYLRRALAEPPNAQDRPTALHELGRAEMLARDPAAVAHLEQALELSVDPLFRGAVALDLGNVLPYVGQVDRAAELLQSSAEQVRGHDRALWFALEALRVVLYHPQALREEVQRRVPELLELASGDEQAARALGLPLALWHAIRGEQCARVAGLVETALAGNFPAQASSESMGVAQGAYALVYVDELDRAERLLRAILEDARRRGSVLGFATGSGLAALVALRRGELASAEADARTTLELSMEHGLQFAAGFALLFLVSAVTERSAVENDVAELTESITLVPALEQAPTGGHLWEARARLRLSQGDTPAAVEALRATGEIWQKCGVNNPLVSPWRSMLGLALSHDAPEQALELINEELRLARRSGMCKGIAIALRARGLAAGGASGLQDLAEAVGLLEDSSGVLEHARALTEYGAALRRAKQRVDAREPLRRGLDLARRCGASRLAERAETELRATGARPRRLLLSGADALTPSERRVADLAAAGMSNPEIAQELFVTLNTIEGHLRHAYQKLSINSREQLPTALVPPATAHAGRAQKTTVPP